MLKVVPFVQSREMGGERSPWGPHYEGPCKRQDKLGASSQEPQEAIKEFNTGIEEVRLCASSTAGLEADRLIERD